MKDKNSTELCNNTEYLLGILRFNDTLQVHYANSLNKEKSWHNSVDWLNLIDRKDGQTQKVDGTQK